MNLKVLLHVLALIIASLILRNNWSNAEYANTDAFPKGNNITSGGIMAIETGVRSPYMFAGINDSKSVTPDILHDWITGSRVSDKVIFVPEASGQLPGTSKDVGLRMGGNDVGNRKRRSTGDVQFHRSGSRKHPVASRKLKNKRSADGNGKVRKGNNSLTPPFLARKPGNGENAGISRKARLAEARKPKKGSRNLARDVNGPKKHGSQSRNMPKSSKASRKLGSQSRSMPKGSKESRKLGSHSRNMPKGLEGSRKLGSHSRSMPKGSKGSRKLGNHPGSVPKGASRKLGSQSGSAPEGASRKLGSQSGGVPKRASRKLRSQSGGVPKEASRKLSSQSGGAPKGASRKLGSHSGGAPKGASRKLGSHSGNLPKGKGTRMFGSPSEGTRPKTGGRSRKARSIASNSPNRKSLSKQGPQRRSLHSGQKPQSTRRSKNPQLKRGSRSKNSVPTKANRKMTGRLNPVSSPGNNAKAFDPKKGLEYRIPVLPYTNSSFDEQQPLDSEVEGKGGEDTDFNEASERDVDYDSYYGKGQNVAGNALGDHDELKNGDKEIGGDEEGATDIEGHAEESGYIEYVEPTALEGKAEEIAPTGNQEDIEGVSSEEKALMANQEDIEENAEEIAPTASQEDIEGKEETEAATIIEPSEASNRGAQNAGNPEARRHRKRKKKGKRDRPFANREFDEEDADRGLIDGIGNTLGNMMHGGAGMDSFPQLPNVDAYGNVMEGLQPGQGKIAVASSSDGGGYVAVSDDGSGKVQVKNFTTADGGHGIAMVSQNRNVGRRPHWRKKKHRRRPRSNNNALTENKGGGKITPGKNQMTGNERNTVRGLRGDNFNLHG